MRVWQTGIGRFLRRPWWKAEKSCRLRTRSRADRLSLIALSRTSRKTRLQRVAVTISRHNDASKVVRANRPGTWTPPVTRCCFVALSIHLKGSIPPPLERIEPMGLAPGWSAFWDTTELWTCLPCRSSALAAAVRKYYARLKHRNYWRNAHIITR